MTKDKIIDLLRSVLVLLILLALLLLLRFANPALYAQDASTWPPDGVTWDANGLVDVADLYSGSGPVAVTLDGATVVWPEEESEETPAFAGFKLTDAANGGPVLTMNGNLVADKPNSDFFDVALVFENDTPGDDAVSRVVVHTPDPKTQARSVFDVIYYRAFVNNQSVSGYGTMEKTGTGTYMTTADSSNFKGNTDITGGMFVIGYDAVYGSEERSGVMTVRDGSDLAFCGGTVSTPPVLNVKTLTFESDSGCGGASLLYNVVGANQCLAKINADTIEVGEGLNLWYDGIGTIEPGKSVTIEISTETDGLRYRDASGNTGTISADGLAAAYSRPLVSFTDTATVGDTRTNHVLTGTVQGVGAYATDRGLDSNQRAAGFALDRYAHMIRNIENYKDIYPAYEMLDILYNERNSGTIDTTLSNMGRTYGVENFYAMTPHFGTAGSVFFCGGDEPFYTFAPCCACQDGVRAQCDDSASSSLAKMVWAAPFYSTIDVDSSNGQDGFNAHRIGIMGGFRGRFDEKTKGGLLFAWSGPKLSQQGTLDGYVDRYDSEMTMSDFQFAAHLERRLGACFELALYLGGGTQSVDWRREVRGNIGMDRDYTGDTTGNTLTATVYLSRPIQCTDRFRLTPVVGFDSEHGWLSDFGENVGVGPITTPGDFSRGVLYSAHRYYDVEYHRNMIRAGLTTDWLGDYGGLRGQVFYGGQIGGDDYATVNTTAFNDIFIMDLEGLEYDKNTLNLGLGLWRHLGSENRIVSADYNANLGKNSTAHQIDARFNWLF